MRAAVAVLVMLLACAASAQSPAPDISGRRLLSAWKGDDASMKMIAEVSAPHVYLLRSLA